MPFTRLWQSDVLYQLLVSRVAQSPTDLVFPFGFYRAAVRKSEALAFIWELRIDARIQTLSSDDGALRHVVPYEQQDQISHADLRAADSST